MSKKGLSMREILKVFKLSNESNHSSYSISKLTGIPRSTVRDYLSRAIAVGLSWPFQDDMTEEKLYALLFPGHQGKKIVVP